MSGQNSRDTLQQNADRLRQGGRIYRYHIHVPSWMVDGDNESDDEQKAINPFWDAYVEEIKLGRYGDLLKRLERLADRYEKARAAKSEVSSVCSDYKTLTGIINTEGQKHGWDKRLIEALGLPGPRAPESHWWTWNWDGGYEPSPKEIDDVVEELGGPTGILYGLYLGEDFKHIRLMYQVPYPASFRGNMTWKEVKEKVILNWNIHEQRLETLRRREETLKFQLDILEAVIAESESVGYVRASSEISQREINEAYDNTVLAWIQKGLMIYDADPAGYTGRMGLINILAEDPPSDLMKYGDPSGLRKLLIRKGLYPNQGERGNPGNEDERLLGEMITLWREAVGSTR